MNAFVVASKFEDEKEEDGRKGEEKKHGDEFHGRRATDGSN